MFRPNNLWEQIKIDKRHMTLCFRLVTRMMLRLRSDAVVEKDQAMHNRHMTRIFITTGTVALLSFVAPATFAQGLGGFGRAGGSSSTMRRTSPANLPTPQSQGYGAGTTADQTQDTINTPDQWSTPDPSAPSRTPIQSVPQYRRKTVITSSGQYTNGSLAPHRPSSVYPFSQDGSTAMRRVMPSNLDGPRSSSPFAPEIGSGEPVRITTPVGQRPLYHNYGNNYIYGYDPYPVNAGYPVFLGGYYYGNYCEIPAPAYSYPSIYCDYSGFPQFIYNPTVIVLSSPYEPLYVGPWQQFYEPAYPVTYNQNTYYVTNEAKAADLESGGVRAQKALATAFPADSYQAAFADIANAWEQGTPSLIEKHVRDVDTKISVSINKKYAYSIATKDYVKITNDALDRLNTVSFRFTRLRKAKNGDVTAYGKHVYTADSSSGNDRATASDGTVPFDQSDAAGAETSSDKQNETMYVAYTLRHKGNDWYIVSVDTSAEPLL